MKRDLDNKIQRLAYGQSVAQDPARAVKQQQFEYAYLFGSVCPRRGIGEAIVVPWVNKEIMIQHLNQISQVTDAVVIMDRAGWHTDDIAEQFNNVSIIKLPPYSPELNPIEQVWS